MHPDKWLTLSSNSLTGFILISFFDIVTVSGWLKEQSWHLKTQLLMTSIHISKQVPGEFIICSSADSMVATNEAITVPIEYLNTLNPAGMPPHQLCLKIGMPRILLTPRKGYEMEQDYSFKMCTILACLNQQ